MKGDVLIHVGLPKTGTTAIQSTLNAGRKQLEQAGFFYPQPHTIEDPKHQFLVTGLLGGNCQGLESRLADCPETLTPIFSAEGLTNHLFDFPEASLAGFRDRLAKHRVKGVLVSRPWDAWLKSYFKQCIVNPPSNQWTHYGFSGDIRGFEQHSRVRPFASLSGLVESVEQRLGLASVDVIDYSSEVVPNFLSYLGVSPADVPPASDPNNSLSDVAAECVRQINGLVRDNRSRRFWVKQIAELDKSNSSVAHSAEMGDGLAAVDLAIMDRLTWEPNSGLDVDLGAFESFLSHLLQAARSTVHSRPAIK